MNTKLIAIKYQVLISHTKQGTLVVEVPIEATEKQIEDWYREEGHEAHYNQHEWVDLDDVEEGEILDVQIEPAAITDRCVTLAFQLREADNSEVVVVPTE